MGRGCLYLVTVAVDIYALYWHRQGALGIYVQYIIGTDRVQGCRCTVLIFAGCRRLTFLHRVLVLPRCRWCICLVLVMTYCSGYICLVLVMTYCSGYLCLVLVMTYCSGYVCLPIVLAEYIGSECLTWVLEG